MQRLMGAAALAALALCAGASGAQAVTNLVTNGNFTSFSSGAANEQLAGSRTSGTQGQGAVLSNWATAGYTFDFTQGSGMRYDPSASCYESCAGNTLTLWGPGNGGVASGTNGTPNGGNTTFTNVPGGGDFVGLDAQYEGPGTISQRVTNLMVGGAYTLVFDYAGAEQFMHNGPTYEGFDVTFGSSAVSAATVQNANDGYTPWVQAAFTFVATSTSQQLTFTATGGPTSADRVARRRQPDLRAGAGDVGGDDGWAWRPDVCGAVLAPAVHPGRCRVSLAATIDPGPVRGSAADWLSFANVY